MKQLFRKLTLALAVSLAASGAQAGLITFDGPSLDTSNAPFAPFFMTDGDTLVQGSFAVTTFNATNSGAPDHSSLVGALIDGVNNTCDSSSLSCPKNNRGAYLASANDGVPVLQKINGGIFNLISFRAAFIGDVGFTNTEASGIRAGFMRVIGVLADGSFTFADASLAGIDSSGSTSFATFFLPTAMQAMNFVEVDFFGFSCNSDGSCTDAFTNNRGQFALDDVEVIPEPGILLLVASALGALAFTRRGRRSV